MLVACMLSEPPQVSCRSSPSHYRYVQSRSERYHSGVYPCAWGQRQLLIPEQVTNLQVPAAANAYSQACGQHSLLLHFPECCRLRVCVSPMLLLLRKKKKYYCSACPRDQEWRGSRRPDSCNVETWHQCRINATLPAYAAFGSRSAHHCCSCCSPVQARLQLHSAAAAWYACAKLLQLCRSELEHVVQTMVRRKEFCTEHKPRHRCATHP